jgi:hypothetical protein
MPKAPRQLNPISVSEALSATAPTGQDKALETKRKRGA